MKITQIGDVELISIKTKSLEDLDNEINFNMNAKPLNKNEYSHVGLKQDFKAKTYDEEYDVFNVDDEEAEDNDHYESSVRFLTIDKSPNGACGFHLTRTKWDPYPWVSAVDDFTPAAKSGLKAGDCVLEVNGCDVLGLRITEIAKLVQSSHHQVTLLLWSSNCNAKCDKENLCAAPMPRSLQRLSLVVQTILSLIECPVCLDTITPPAMQCQNGHLLCVDCRIRAEKCPVCRDRYFPRPALIAEQIQSAITSAFNLCRNEDKVRQKVFGRHNRQRQMVRVTLAGLQQKQQQTEKHQQQHKSFRENPLIEGEETNTATRNTTAETSEAVIAINRNVTDKFVSICSTSFRNTTTCNKLFTKILNSKAYSMENLTNVEGCIGTTANNNFSTCQATIKSAISQFEFFDTQQQQHQHHSSHEPVAGHRAIFKDFERGKQQQQKSTVTNTNQFYDSPRNIARIQHFLTTHVSKPQLDSTENDFHLNTNLCCRQMVHNKMEHFSLSSDKEFAKSKENITCILDSSTTYLNNENEVSSTAIVCETSNATVPRAIRLMDKL